MPGNNLNRGVDHLREPNMDPDVPDGDDDGTRQFGRFPRPQEHTIGITAYLSDTRFIFHGEVVSSGLELKVKHEALLSRGIYHGFERDQCEVNVKVDSADDYEFGRQLMEQLAQHDDRQWSAGFTVKINNGVLIDPKMWTTTLFTFMVKDLVWQGLNAFPTRLFRATTNGHTVDIQSIIFDTGRNYAFWFGTLLAKMIAIQVPLPLWVNPLTLRLLLQGCFHYTDHRIDHPQWFKSVNSLLNFDAPMSPTMPFLDGRTGARRYVGRFGPMHQITGDTTDEYIRAAGRASAEDYRAHIIPISKGFFSVIHQDLFFKSRFGLSDFVNILYRSSNLHEDKRKQVCSRLLFRNLAPADQVIFPRHCTLLKNILNNFSPVELFRFVFYMTRSLLPFTEPTFELIITFGLVAQPTLDPETSGLSAGLCIPICTPGNEEEKMQNDLLVAMNSCDLNFESIMYQTSMDDLLSRRK